MSAQRPLVRRKNSMSDEPPPLLGGSRRFPAALRAPGLNPDCCLLYRNPLDEPKLSSRLARPELASPVAC
jgi:hypothetical protein